jgi:uncharacterized protein (DUF1499 family)
MRKVVWIAVLVLVLILPLALAGGALIGNRLPWRAPPGPWARLALYLTTHEAVQEDNASRPELRPLAFAMPPARIQGLVVAACQALRWEVTEIATDERTLRVSAVVTTRLLRFRDEVTVEIRPAIEGQASVLRARSRSRVGQGDFGANTRHLLDLAATLARLTAF